MFIHTHVLKEIARVAEAYADRISVSRMLLYVSALIDTSFGDARSYVKEDGSYDLIPKTNATGVASARTRKFSDKQYAVCAKETNGAAKSSE